MIPIEYSYIATIGLWMGAEVVGRHLEDDTANIKPWVKQLSNSWYRWPAKFGMILVATLMMHYYLNAVVLPAFQAGIIRIAFTVGAAFIGIGIGLSVAKALTEYDYQAVEL